MSRPGGLLDDDLPQFFSSGAIPPAEQLRMVAQLQAEIETVRTGSVAVLAARGADWAKKTPGDFEKVEAQRALMLDMCNWQMALLLKASTPTRITEAEPYIQAVIDKQKIDKPTAQLEATPHLMLAAAIHKTPGREAEAYKLLKDALKNGDNGANPPTILMAKASVARALRRVYRVREAKELETAVIRWILNHQHVPPSMIRKDVGDAAAPPGTRDMILDDPRLKKYFSSRVEMPGMGMFGGTAVITFG